MTFANPDGSKTSVVTPVPTRWSDAAGWHDIDLSLTSGSDGTFGAASSPLGVRLPGSANAGLKLPSSAGSITLSHTGAASAPAQSSGSSASFSAAMQGRGLLETLLTDGVEESVTLPSAAVDSSYVDTFALPAGVTAVQAGSQVQFLSASGEVLGAFAPAWAHDAATDHPAESPVTVTLTGVTGGKAWVQVSVDAAWAKDPARVFPVTIDPTYYVNTSTSGNTDTYVQSGSGASLSFGTSTEIRSGYGFGTSGTDVARGLIKFDLGSLVSVQNVVTEAHVRADNFASASCAGTAAVVTGLAGSFSNTSVWGTQPAKDSYGQVSSTTFSHGQTGCAAAWENLDVTALASRWVNGAETNNGLIIQSNEISSGGFKKFYSGESGGASAPALYVTYDRRPYTPSHVATAPPTPCVTGSGRGFLNTTTPALTASSGDIDGSPTRLKFEVSNVTGGVVYTGIPAAGYVPQATLETQVVPASTLLNGSSYSWRVQSDDGLLTSALWSSPSCEFTVDTTPPSTTTISSSTHSANAWTAVSTGSFTLSATDTTPGSVDHYLWALDDTQPTTETGSTLSGIALPDGWHTLSARAVDKAGNLGAVASYSFGTLPAVTTPGAGAVTNQSLALRASAPKSGSAQNFTFYYRRADADQWTPVPASNVTGTGFSGWPFAATIVNDGDQTPALTWNAFGSLGDSPVQLAVCVSSSSCPSTASTTLPTGISSTIPAQATVDSKDFNIAATQSLGAASVNLLTGNAQVSGSDVSVPGTGGTSLSISRTLNSATAGSATPGIFGNGWTASVPVDSAGADWTGITDTGSVLTLKGPDQTTVTFAKHDSTSWTPTGDDADSGLLLKTSSDTACTGSPATVRCLELDDADGNIVTFQQTTSPLTTAGTLTVPVNLAVQTVKEPSSATATSFVRTTLPGTSIITPTRVTSPAPPVTGADCSNPTVSAHWTTGCRALELAYGATSGTPSYNHLTSATYDVNMGSGLVQVDVGCWAYNSSGQLSDVWDPRDIPTAAIGSHPIVCNPAAPVRPTHYDYDASGRVSKITPAYSASSPAIAGTDLTYDATSGRLTKVSRTHLSGFTAGTEATQVVYGVPLSGDTVNFYHPDLTSATVATWGQADEPDSAVGGTAVCPPGSSPSTPTVTGDLRDCTITYLDVNGRAVNTASYSGTGLAGWHITTTEYDSAGHTIRTLSASDREEALNPTGTAGAAIGLSSQTQVAAMQLSTINIYTPNPHDGLGEPDLTDSFGPLHKAVIPGATDAGNEVPVRSHTHSTFDTGSESGHPSGGTLHLAMTTTTAASQSPDAVATNEVDTRTTSNTYDTGSGTSGWTFRTPLKTVTDPSGLNLINAVTLDNNGRTITSSMPNDQASGTPGATSGTMVSVYYSGNTISGADSDCGSQPALDGMLCKTYPAELTPAGGAPGLITTKYSYDYLGRTTSTVETPSGDSAHARTSTTVFGFNSTITSGVSANPYANATQQSSLTGGLGTAVSASSTTFDAATGLPTSTTSGSSDLSTYDDFGRVISYEENHGGTGTWNIATTSYDPNSGRVTTSADNHQSTTTTYNGGTEHRGLPTHMQTDVTTTSGGTVVWSGIFDAVYDSDGAISTQTDNSTSTAITSTLLRDEAGQLLSRTDQRGSAAWLNDSVTRSVFGQIRTENTTVDASVNNYDAAGRLSRAHDDPVSTDVACATRDYTFDNDSNRLTSVTTPYTLDSNGNCGTAGSATTLTHGYDHADRLTSANGDTGLVYDSFGRTTTLPAADTNNSAAGNLTLGYFSSDLVQSQSTSATAQCWTLDANQRLSEATTRTGTSPTCSSGTLSADTVNHYDAAGGDSPDWIGEKGASGSSTNWTANVSDLLGGLVDTVAYDTTSSTTTATRQHSNLHGDIEASSASADSAPTFAPTFTEFGVQADTSAHRYGWLGGKQRASDDQAGLILMGVRLYDPLLGRFLQTDPVPGGSWNDYDYANQDPIGAFDLDGRLSRVDDSGGDGYCGSDCHHWRNMHYLASFHRHQKRHWWQSTGHVVGVVAGYVSWIPGPVGNIAAGVSALGYTASGEYSKALMSAIQMVAGHVGDKLLERLSHIVWHTKGLSRVARNRIIRRMAYTHGIGRGLAYNYLGTLS